MVLQLRWFHQQLKFKFDAKTSRGSLHFHNVFYLKLFDSYNPEIAGVGEAAPLSGLSPDANPDFEINLNSFCRTFNQKNFRSFQTASEWVLEQNLAVLPSLKFGLETAFIDFAKGGKRILFDTDFTSGKAGIPINGLIWMGDKEFMLSQIYAKLEAGYTCLKLKIGGLDFETECAILKTIREIAPIAKLTIRLDANGAFHPKEARLKLERLSAFNIHSIEQPIKPGYLADMKTICLNSPIPIALDEELIGVTNRDDQLRLLEQIMPDYLILKPTLLGGLKETSIWIGLAQNLEINWWITSALESNIGLNAIAQYTATLPNLIPQGLGTGQLYFNNIASPLEIRNGFLYYNSRKPWQPLPE